MIATLDRLIDSLDYRTAFALSGFVADFGFRLLFVSGLYLCGVCVLLKFTDESRGRLLVCLLCPIAIIVVHFSCLLGQSDHQHS